MDLRQELALYVFCRTPHKQQNLFPENTFPGFGHCRINDPRRNILQNPLKPAKHFPRKHVSPFWALSHADFMEIILWHPRKTAKPFPGKHVCPFWALSPKCFRVFGAKMCIFLLGVFGTFIFMFFA